MSVNIKPLEDRVLVQALEAEETTASGLVIPDTAKEKPQEGKVLAVGPGRFDEDGAKRIPLDIKVGDTVIYSKYGGTEVKYNGEEYLILRERDIHAVVDQEPGDGAPGDVQTPTHQHRQVASLQVGLANLHIVNPGLRGGSDLCDEESDPVGRGPILGLAQAPPVANEADLHGRRGAAD